MRHFISFVLALFLGWILFKFVLGIAFGLFHILMLIAMALLFVGIVHWIYTALNRDKLT